MYEGTCARVKKSENSQMVKYIDLNSKDFVAIKMCVCLCVGVCIMVGTVDSALSTLHTEEITSTRNCMC